VRNALFYLTLSPLDFLSLPHIRSLCSADASAAIARIKEERAASQLQTELQVLASSHSVPMS
jgi:hypothetical protein